MRHFLLLLCSLLLFTNAVSANEFTGYLTNEWGVELSINIEEVTSSHITRNDIQTTDSLACPGFLCVCMDVRDEEKSSFDSYRKRALIKPQTWKVPNIRNAIPKSEDSYIIGIAYTSYIAVDAPEMDLLSDMASCTLCATSQEQQNWFTNESLYAHANLRVNRSRRGNLCAECCDQQSCFRAVCRRLQSKGIKRRIEQYIKQRGKTRSKLCIECFSSYLQCCNEETTAKQNSKRTSMQATNRTKRFATSCISILTAGVD